jgi:hypothetical protein
MDGDRIRTHDTRAEDMRADDPRTGGTCADGTRVGDATAEGRPGRPHGAEGAGPHRAAGASWGMASAATLHCLTGCAIGEVLGMVIGTVAGLHGVVTVVLAVVLAFFFGYALTMRGVLRTGVRLRQALRIALAADTVSIAVMELTDNAIIVGIPGAMDAGLASILFWGALALALAVAYGVTLPINRWMIGRGKGHAVAHARH